jgi:small GTP-binding protein
MSGETYNVVLFGTAGVGKTSSLVQLREKRYAQLDASFATEDTHFTEVVVDGEKAVLSILDTATSPKNYSADRDAFIKSADGYLVMYSIDVSQSFHEIWQYKDQVMALRKDDAPVFPVLLAGNKSDLDLVREVMQKDALDLASTWGSIPALELSSKDHTSVEIMYHTIVREMRKFRKLSALQKRQKADQCSVM